MTQPAARLYEKTSHPGMIAGPGVSSVLIGGLPAAVAGDKHLCALPPNAGPHAPSSMVGGSSSVTIGGQPAMRLADQAGCGAVIISGEFSVRIGG